MVLALLSLLVVSLLPQRAIAEPVEIQVRSSNIKVYAFEKVLDRWGEKEWDYFNELIERESHWDSEAQNPYSTAYGLAQFLNSTWKTVGCKKTADKYEQIDCAVKYIEARYKTPKKAIEFHNRKNWY